MEVFYYVNDIFVLKTVCLRRNIFDIDTVLFKGKCSGKIASFGIR